MQVTSQVSGEAADAHAQHDHDDPNCASCGHDHEHTSIKLTQLLVGVIFVVNAFIVEWVLETGTIVDDISAMIGAIILGYPIILTGIRDLRKGLLSINELVSLAVLAAFSSGDYKTAGVVDITTKTPGEDLGRPAPSGNIPPIV